MRHVRWSGASLLFVAVAAGLASIGCRARAGGQCTPGDLNTCPHGYYCAQVEVCTKVCSEAEDCRVACSTSSQCAMGERCTDAGMCASSVGMACIDGYCQRPCYAPDGGCERDAYAPTSRHASTDQ